MSGSAPGGGISVYTPGDDRFRIIQGTALSHDATTDPHTFGLLPAPPGACGSVRWRRGWDLSIRILGREIATLVDEPQQPGTREVLWDASGRASGVYFCRLEVTAQSGEGFTEVRCMIYIRQDRTGGAREPNALTWGGGGPSPEALNAMVVDPRGMTLVPRGPFLGCSV